MVDQLESEIRASLNQEYKDYLKRQANNTLNGDLDKITFLRTKLPKDFDLSLLKAKPGKNQLKDLSKLMEDHVIRYIAQDNAAKAQPKSSATTTKNAALQSRGSSGKIDPRQALKAADRQIVQDNRILRNKFAPYTKQINLNATGIEDDVKVDTTKIYLGMRATMETNTKLNPMHSHGDKARAIVNQKSRVL